MSCCKHYLWYNCCSVSVYRLGGKKLTSFLHVQYLYNLHEVAEKNNDGQFADFVEVMLEEQVNFYLQLICHL